MTKFAPFNTARLRVKLQELPIGDAIDLCSTHASLVEQSTTELLDAIVVPDPAPKAGVVVDNRLWTVQERAGVVAHYLAQVRPDGPDFIVTGDYKLTDYRYEHAQHCDPSVKLGKLGDDDWTLYPLLGMHADSIERLIFSERMAGDRAGWWFGAMAATLFTADPKHAPPEAWGEFSEHDLDEYLLNRVNIFRKIPQSGFIAILQMFLSGISRLEHIFILDFGPEGLVFLPTEKAQEEAAKNTPEGKEVPVIPPARFPVSSAIHETTRKLFGKPE